MDIEAIVAENRALREREAALLERANLFQRSAEHLQRQVELLERSAALADKLAVAQRERIEMLEGKLETLSLELAKLKRQVTGPKSERRRDDDTAQASLFASEADPCVITLDRSGPIHEVGRLTTPALRRYAPSPGPWGSGPASSFCQPRPR